MKCKVDNCNNLYINGSVKNQLCSKHYKRWIRHGTYDLHPKYQRIEFKKSLLKEGKYLCACCNNIKSIEDFSPVKGRLGQVRCYCKPCNNLKNPLSRSRNTELKRKYNLTLDDYNALLKQQGYVCKICKQAETAIISKNKNQTIRSLSVDHDHSTGEIRGLLCGRCNKAIGSLEENKELFYKCIDYLNKHKEKIKW